jgi:hypothetical protein
VTSSVSRKRSPTELIARGGSGNRTRVQGFAGPCLSHSAIPPGHLGHRTVQVLEVRRGPEGFLRADDGIRTRDPHLGKVMRYQLRYVRVCSVSAALTLLGDPSAGLRPVPPPPPRPSSILLGVVHQSPARSSATSSTRAMSKTGQECSVDGLGLVDTRGVACAGAVGSALHGRLAQGESASFTPKRSLVRSQYRPPRSEARLEIFESSRRRRTAAKYSYGVASASSSRRAALASVRDIRFGAAPEGCQMPCSPRGLPVGRRRVRRAAPRRSDWG